MSASGAKNHSNICNGLKLYGVITQPHPRCRRTSSKYRWRPEG